MMREVRELQFIHGLLSVPTPRVLHRAPFPAKTCRRALELDTARRVIFL